MFLNPLLDGGIGLLISGGFPFLVGCGDGGKEILAPSGVLSPFLWVLMRF